MVNELKKSIFGLPYAPRMHTSTSMVTLVGNVAVRASTISRFYSHMINECYIALLSFLLSCHVSSKQNYEMKGIEEENFEVNIEPKFDKKDLANANRSLATDMKKRL